MRPDELERRLQERLDALGPAPRAERRSPVVRKQPDEADDEPDDRHEHKRPDDHPAEPTGWPGCYRPRPPVRETGPAPLLLETRHRVVSSPLLGHGLSIGLLRQNLAH